MDQTTPDQNKPGEVTSALKPECVNEMPGPGVGAQIKGLSSEPASAQGAGESPGCWAPAARPLPPLGRVLGRRRLMQQPVGCKPRVLSRGPVQILHPRVPDGRFPAAVIGKSRGSQTGFVNDAISSCVRSSPTAGSGVPRAVSWWSWSHARALPARCKRWLWRLRA